jgi:hypothetical protein
MGVREPKSVGWLLQQMLTGFLQALVRVQQTVQFAGKARKHFCAST